MKNTAPPVERETEGTERREFGFVEPISEGPLVLDFGVQAVHELLDRYHLEA